MQEYDHKVTGKVFYVHRMSENMKLGTKETSVYGVWREYCWNHGDYMIDVYQQPANALEFKAAVSSPYLREDFLDVVSKLEEK